MRTLLVERHFQDIKRALLQQGLLVDTVNNSQEADRKLHDSNYEIVILNLETSRTDGFALIKDWRQRGIEAYVMITTTHSALETKVNALNAGADDCLAKPYHLDELMARVRTHIRRYGQSTESVMKVHDLEIDVSSRVIRRAGSVISLTPREFDILRLLASHRGKEVSRSLI